MSFASSNPAVFTGLLGNHANLVSTVGKAVSLEGAYGKLQLFSTVCFAAAAISGVAAVIVAVIVVRDAGRVDMVDEVPSLEFGEDRRHVDQMEDDEQPLFDGESAYVQQEAREQQIAPAPQTMEEKKPAPTRGRHMRVVEAPVEVPPAVAPIVERAAAMASESRFARRHANTVEVTGTVNIGSHATTDYGDIAENYVRKHTLRERMAARAAGVASVLADRLGKDMFDDLPVISRADGSVGDVGTSWWDNALGPNIRRTGAILEDTASREPLDASDVMKMQTAPYQPIDITLAQQVAANTIEFAPLSAIPQASIPKQQAERTPQEIATARERALLIARSVAEVDTGVFPAQRDASELDDKDLWNVALKAMGDSIVTQSAQAESLYDEVAEFKDQVGNSETIDEPSGLEGSTSFLAFKRPAGHPEVVDNESYVDYLINEEFSQNTSSAARRSSRHYLRLIQGGSQKSRPLPVQEARQAYVGRHFAKAPDGLMAKEA